MLQATGVMCAPLQSPADALRNPQYHSRDFFQRLDCESEVIVPGPSFRLEAGAPPPTPAAAPRIGQHTESVLTDWLGLSTAELQTLRRIGAVR